MLNKEKLILKTIKQRIRKIENFSGYMEHWYQKKQKRLHKIVSFYLTIWNP